MTQQTRSRATAARKAKSAVMPIRRDIKFKLPADRINDWHMSGGPQFTAFLNTFSIVLPVGERFFIDAVRAHRELIKDPELQKAVTAFIGQEAMHGREHEAYNDALYAVSKVAPKFERLVAGLLNLLKERTPKSARLSATIALEHFTALLAQQVLENEQLTKGQEPHFAAVWYWHALEETEHKAVAYDVWEAVMGRGPRAYFERASGQLLATAIFWALITPTFLEVVREQGKLTDFAGWRKFMRYAFGEVGLIRRLVRPWADYFRPDFHPWDHDNRQYLAQIDAFVAAQAQLQAA
ncbi:metal-dependent hydrolase [Fontimonas sp. SYSU GA230001]|uniref:metal-dependent hydrolase n=1 Tax=Fontimonas sp. SYSU GA230001 TaxID=3142450 RepID=UPI0032B40C6F